MTTIQIIILTILAVVIVLMIVKNIFLRKELKRIKKLEEL